MTIRIRGTGTALPIGSIDQADAAHTADRLRRIDESESSVKKAKLLANLYRRSGVKRRHCVLLNGEEGDPLLRQSFYLPTKDLEHRGPSTESRMQVYEASAPALAEAACRAALADAGKSPKEVTHLVTVSCSGFAAPGFDLELYDRIDLTPTASRTHVGFMGCHGFLNGLRVASAYAASDPDACVLVCAVELCSLHHQYTDDPQQIVANSLFADGAGAAVVQHCGIGPEGERRGELEEEYQGLGRLVSNGSLKIPNTENLMSWKIGDHGFRMTLSPQVPEVIQRDLKPWVVQWLGKYGMKLEDVRHWAIHPGGPRILSSTSESLGLPPDATEVSTQILSEFGNMSSPTILFILDRMKRLEYRPPIVALAFGPGLVVEAALFL